jgi:hypothetical protein
VEHPERTLLTFVSLAALVGVGGVMYRGHDVVGALVVLLCVVLPLPYVWRVDTPHDPTVRRAFTILIVCAYVGISAALALHR